MEFQTSWNLEVFQCTDFRGFLICHFKLYLEFKNEESLLLQFVDIGIGIFLISR